MALRSRLPEFKRLPLLLPESIALAVQFERRTTRRSICADGSDAGGEFSGESAYEVLGVSESCSSAEIKRSFRRLAKETHPDVASRSPGDEAASRRFLQVLAAYEILSDSKRRAHYDTHLFSRRKMLQKHTGLASVVYAGNSSVAMMKQSEVVEWLKCYRLVIDDILTQKKVVVGSGYIDKLENELYSAIRAAYFGPIVESFDLLPNCFEAEERSAYETPEVLHLVSGRDLFGIVYLVNKIPELSDTRCEKLSPSISMSSGICQFVRQAIGGRSSTSSEGLSTHTIQNNKNNYFESDVYKDLELHISGRIVATATRSPPICKSSGSQTVGSEDHINVFLCLNEDMVKMNESIFPDSVSHASVGSRFLLGTITGLGTNAEEGICSVYDRSGTKTHVIMKHRTLMVKHMHWYQAGGEVAACECRCSRARLPPSKFWLFEPRSSMHDVGGWCIETFGRDKKGRTVPSQREWDVITEHPEKRLHPAMYLLALAYRTLDLEAAKRNKGTVRKFVEPKLNSVLRWWKKVNKGIALEKDISRDLS